MRMANWLKQKLSAWGGVVLLGFVMTIVSGLPARADLEFCNHTAEKQWVAVGYKSEGVWQSEGWWGVDADDCATPIIGDLEFRHYYYRLFESSFVGEGFSFCLKKEVFESEDADDCDSDGFEPADFAGIDTGPNALSYTFAIIAPASDSKEFDGMRHQPARPLQPRSPR